MKKDKETGLNIRQKKFCEVFLSKDFYGNGVESYAEAYNKDLTNPKEYNACRSLASKLLTNVNILAYINQLMEEGGLNDAFVDKQLLLSITQNADFGSKIAAIREYNKLKQRITDKMKIEGDFSFTLDLKK